MKINKIEVIGDKFAYDGCHKIYILEDKNDIKEAESYGYKIYDIALLYVTYESSCSLKFISNWKLDKQYVKQFEENVIFGKI